MPVPAADSLGNSTSAEDAKEISDRKLNIERMMEELEAMKAKKQELIERNNRLKENQEKPAREYSSSVTRSNAALADSASANKSRKMTTAIGSHSSALKLSNAKNSTSPTILVSDEIKEVKDEEDHKTGIPSKEGNETSA